MFILLFFHHSIEWYNWFEDLSALKSAFYLGPRPIFYGQNLALRGIDLKTWAMNSADEECSAVPGGAYVYVTDTTVSEP